MKLKDLDKFDILLLITLTFLAVPLSAILWLVAYSLLLSV